MERSGKGWDELLKRYRISGIVDTEKGWEGFVGRFSRGQVRIV